MYYNGLTTETKSRDEVMCKRVQDTEKLVAPPRFLAIVALCLVSASHCYSLAAFSAFAGFLAVDLNWAEDLDHSGVIVGVLGTCVPAARIPVSMLWGLAMDRFGRRPCLILTSVCLMVGQMVFPFMTSFWAALFVRFTLLGMGNGWVILMAVCCAELGGQSRQAELLGYVIGAGGVINLIGPGLGGYTYRILGTQFPALMPCLLGAGLSATAAVAVRCALPETRPPRRAAAEPTVELTAPAVDKDALNKHEEPKGVSSSTRLAPVVEVNLTTALCSRPLPLLVALRCMLGFIGFLKMTVVPLWAIASEHVGGLALDHHELGLMLSLSAAVGLLYSTLMMARVIKHAGVRTAMLGSGVVAALGFLLMPRTQRLPFPIIVLLLSMLEMAHTTCFTCTIAAVNNVCCRYPNMRGAINGVNVTIESAAKALGPALGGALYAYTIAQPMPPTWPNASVLYFGGVGALMSFFCIGVSALPRSIDTTATDHPPTPAGAIIRRQPSLPRVRIRWSLGRSRFRRLSEPELAD